MSYDWTYGGRRRRVNPDVAEAEARAEAILRALAAASDSSFDDLLSDDDGNDDGAADLSVQAGNQHHQHQRESLDFGLPLAPAAPVAAALAALQSAIAAADLAAPAGAARPVHGRWTWPERAVVLALGKLSKAVRDASEGRAWPRLRNGLFVRWLKAHGTAVDAALSPFPPRSAAAYSSGLREVALMPAASVPPERAHLREEARVLLRVWW